MRPKVVILTLVFAFALLGAVAVIKGVFQKPAGDGAGLTVATQNTTPTDTHVPAATHGAVGSNGVAVSEEIRQAIIDKELDQIHTLEGEADGTNNPVIIAALLEKMNNQEAEVRRGVVQALKELNDTNAVPGLQRMSVTLADPRERVAVLDAIEYLQAPGILDNLTPEQMTNNYKTGPTNARFMKAPSHSMHQLRDNGSAASNGGQTPAPASPGTQSP